MLPKTQNFISNLNKKRIFITLLALTAVTICAEPSTSRPNIVFILIDDMPWWGTSVSQQADNRQSTSIFRNTPNLEKLAARGMTFSNAYAAAGMCTPSRASIQTGLSPARHLLSGNGNFHDENPLEVIYALRSKDKGALLIPPAPMGHLDSKFTTIGEVMRKQGYATAHLGKWHVYGGGPEEHGYDISDGETSNNEGAPKSGIAADDPKRIFSITERGIQFIEKQHEAGKPFFCQISHYVEHNAQMALPETLEAFENMAPIKAVQSKKYRRQTAGHGSAVKDLDTSIGLILKRLDELGIRDNTYIVFTSDNGKGLYNGDDGILRGSKWWLWEAGIRVPFIVEGPGVEPQSRNALNIVGYDMLPTFYEIAGGDPKELGDIDGTSILPLLKGENPSSFDSRPLYFHYPHNRTSTPHSAIIKGDYKLLTFYEIPEFPHLFNLSIDLGEETNLADQMPERAEAMLNELNGYLYQYNAYFPKPNPNADSRPRFDPESKMPPLSRAPL
ncbi:MAG: sulfatase [Verrucomicrobiota bacterium]